MSDFTVVDAVNKQHDKRRIAELEADNKRLSKYAKGWHGGHRVGMERIAELEQALQIIVDRQDHVRTSDYCYNIARKALREEIEE